MSSNPNTQTKVLLKDGRTTLATWSQEFGKNPTIGDSISISDHWTDPLPGFLDQARVAKIELDTKTKQQRIELEAITTAKQRPVVFLNSSRIRKPLQGKVETYIRQQIPLALPSWEESAEATAILRVHENGHVLKESLSALQDGVRSILNAGQPAGV